jgi:hypothetical protein
MTGLSDACQPYRESFSDLIEGEMDGQDAKRIEHHLDECSNCRSEMVVLRGVVRTLAGIGEEAVPTELVGAVMTRVKTEPLWLRVWEFIKEPFGSMPVRALAGCAALCLLFFSARPYLPIEIRIETKGPAGEQASISPVWWGGTLYVNDKAIAPIQSGRLALRPGDAVKTTEHTQLSLAYGEANVEVLGQANLIIKNDGLYLANGRITARIDDARAKIRPGTTFQVTTPLASIVHLGTVFSVTHLHDVTNVEVASGQVMVNGSKVEAHQVLTAGRSVTVNSDGSIETPAANASQATRPAAERSENIPMPGKNDATGR